MAYGWYSFDMEELEGQEAANARAGIMLHGGGSACGWPGAWQPHQALHPTLGYLRLHNINYEIPSCSSLSEAPPTWGCSSSA